MLYGTLPRSELVNGIKKNKFTASENNEISSFLERALIRLEAWFQWFNTTQSGMSDFYFLFFGFFWRGRCFLIA